MLACMHTIFLYDFAHILVQLAMIKNIGVSTERGGGVDHDYGVHTCTQPCTNVSMHAC